MFTAADRTAIYICMIRMIIIRAVGANARSAVHCGKLRASGVALQGWSPSNSTFLSAP